MQTNSPNNTIPVGGNIKFLRTKLGITQDALAQFLGITREYIAYYEAGSRPVPTIHLSKMANLFCMNEFDFYEENPEKSKINIAFAFRADSLQPEDLNSIALFKKVVRNYINMKSALTDE